MALTLDLNGQSCPYFIPISECGIHPSSTVIVLYSIDFHSVLNDGKILLANLSTGRLTEKISGTMGSFLVTKIVNAAFRRANLPEAQRRRWQLYGDAYQSFMKLSVGFERILSEARKTGLILAGLANQYIGQVTPTVRQAIFDNIGTLIIVFRLGVDDTQMVSRELGVFASDEVLNLGVGQAFVRNKTSSDTYGLQSHPKPTPARIQALTRAHYATPAAEVEAELGGVSTTTRFPANDDRELNSEPDDPSEDELAD